MLIDYSTVHTVPGPALVIALIIEIIVIAPARRPPGGPIQELRLIKHSRLTSRVHAAMHIA
jgi:hypothetical protein